MTLKQYLFDDQPDGTTVTTSNSGATLVNAAGGTIKFSASAANNGPCGIMLTGASSGSYTVARFPMAAPNNVVQFSGVFVVPTLPSATVTLATLRAGGGALISLGMRTNGRMDVNIAGTPSGNIPTTTPLTTTAGSKYRWTLEADLGAGTVTYALYNADGTTALDTSSESSITFSNTPPAVEIELGMTNIGGPFQVGWYDVQINDGAGSEIGPINHEAASTVRPNSVVDADDWSAHNASDLAVALADNDDTTYAESPAAADNDAFTVAFPVLDDGVVTVKTRAAKSSSDATGTLKVELLQTDTVIASDTFTLTASPVDYQFTTTTAEAANISDRSALRVRHTATIS